MVSYPHEGIKNRPGASATGRGVVGRLPGDDEVVGWRVFGIRIVGQNAVAMLNLDVESLIAKPLRDAVQRTGLVSEEAAEFDFILATSCGKAGLPFEFGEHPSSLLRVLPLLVPVYFFRQTSCFAREVISILLGLRAQFGDERLCDGGSSRAPCDLTFLLRRQS